MTGTTEYFLCKTSRKVDTRHIQTVLDNGACWTVKESLCGSQVQHAVRASVVVVVVVVSCCLGSMVGQLYWLG